MLEPIYVRGVLREVWGVEAQTLYRHCRVNPDSRKRMGQRCPFPWWNLKLSGRVVAIAIPLGNVKVYLACMGGVDGGGKFPYSPKSQYLVDLIILTTSI